MFERFTHDARRVVTRSCAHSERTGDRTVTEEHLLLALLDQQGTRTAFAFAALGVTDRRASVEDALRTARRRGGLSPADVRALAGLGIDVDEVVAGAEAAHGRGALDPGVSGRFRAARRRWTHQPFSPGAKATLEKSLRIAVGRGDRAIGGEHVLLALTAGPGVVAEVLADHGATYASLERVMFARPDGPGPGPGDGGGGTAAADGPG
ncbi:MULTISPECIES: Clp protease N-terminal domain-containing protein [Streptomyces]|uniref:Peptidase n=1 Tax=Streptomyces tsukubensis (strain DSM 42081 / NBRC 108919 / NRRL 18488 / 9993) TaxID=1114943 RepID=A0A7G3UMB0_STRT9|nr:MULTISPECIES: Clp protease N-terminal domain-containing protein [Streptomyces]AZK96448.1 peptidase [Streptomyces tsukubensis]MYS66864.1 peptidase [Streptomyces sp. SID5473]QKM71517.1 peptidase [Streptomyces tsukubensis NRRL18488]TAI44632.1 peptidase [Streptomyces tsukubensis]